MSELKKFVNTLESEHIFKFNINHFSSRIRLQKYVYIASFYNDILNYTFTLYIHGPYSKKLADDYYLLNNIKTTKTIKISKDFISMIDGKGEKWLEYASTMLLFNQINPSLSKIELIRKVNNTKPEARTPFLNSIYAQLDDNNLV